MASPEPTGRIIRGSARAFGAILLSVLVGVLTNSGVGVALLIFLLVICGIVEGWFWMTWNVQTKWTLVGVVIFADALVASYYGYSHQPEPAADSIAFHCVGDQRISQNSTLQGEMPKYMVWIMESNVEITQKGETENDPSDGSLLQLGQMPYLSCDVVNELPTVIRNPVLDFYVNSYDMGYENIFLSFRHEWNFQMATDTIKADGGEWDFGIANFDGNNGVAVYPGSLVATGIAPIRLLSLQTDWITQKIFKYWAVMYPEPRSTGPWKKWLSCNIAVRNATLQEIRSLLLRRHRSCRAEILTPGATPDP